MNWLGADLVVLFTAEGSGVAFWLAAGTALWLGIMTSISPCPLASNIAAISFIGRQVGEKRAVLFSGLLYTLGRTLTYVAVAMLVLSRLLDSDEVARFLQRYLNQALGPVLILVGMLLLGLLGESLSFNLAGERVQQKAAKGGLWWAGILGILFALSFCPVSAALFFGGLLSLSAKAESRLLLPTLFGIGSAVPVLVFAFLMAYAAESVGRAFNRLTAIEKWVRSITGAVFILAGLYYCLRYVYGLPL